jgi:hypothetical protein
LRRGMLGFGRSKVNGLSLVPVPPHMIHALINLPHIRRFVAENSASACPLHIEMR